MRKIPRRRRKETPLVIETLKLTRAVEELGLLADDIVILNRTSGFLALSRQMRIAPALLARLLLDGTFKRDTTPGPSRILGGGHIHTTTEIAA